MQLLFNSKHLFPEVAAFQGGDMIPYQPHGISGKAPFITLCKIWSHP